MVRRDPPEEEPQTFTWPLLGALYGSLVIVGVVAVLDSHVGRSLDDKVGAPAQALIAVPVVIVASVVAIACLVALLAPQHRRPSLKVAEIGSWLIPAWLVMGAMVLGAISFALSPAD
jgi:protein-S-isoprenylcysteine O-methyltransferase Ste14